MKIVFIADAHLKGIDDPNQATLARFLEGIERVDRLIILGDLFDYWSGYNEVVYMNYKPALEALKKIKGRGIEIIYIEGNHDFSMGSFFTDTLGVKVYPVEAVINFDNKKALLTHGDTVNMTFAHALWRAFLRSFLLRIIVKITPPEALWRIAMRLSKKSRGYNIKGVMVEERLREFARARIGEGMDIVVTGHSHSAGVHKETAGGRTGFYANPGSWSNGMSYLLYENGEIKVERFWG